VNKLTTMKKIIKQIEPVKKSQERVIYDDGTSVLRCYGPHNPHYYEDESHNLYPIEIDHLEEKTTGIGQSYLRSKNIVSVGFRKDSNSKKYLGLRPDFNQKEGNEQLEFSIEKIEFDGKEIPIDLSKNKIINSIAVDLGNVMIISSRQFTRQAVKVNSNISDFKIVYRMYLKGLEVKYRKDLDEYWIYNFDGEFRFRIRRPYILSVENREPLNNCDPLENIVYNYVRHSLTKQKDGTYLYIKEPTKEFLENPPTAPFLIDADTYYGDTDDGYSYYQNDSWATCRAAATGTAGDNCGTTFKAMASHSGSTYTIQRLHVFFDTSGASDPASATLWLYVSNDDWDHGTVMAMKSTSQMPTQFADYDSFTGDRYGYGTPGGENQWWGLTLNSTGINDIDTGGTTKICVRNSWYDHLNHTPGDNTAYGYAFRSANYSGSTTDPQLVITETPPAMRINISDVWKDVDEVKINISDSWKTVTEVKINIGDAWKVIF